MKLVEAMARAMCEDNGIHPDAPSTAASFAEYYVGGRLIRLMPEEHLIVPAWAHFRGEAQAAFGALKQMVATTED